MAARGKDETIPRGACRNQPRPGTWVPNPDRTNFRVDLKTQPGDDRLHKTKKNKPASAAKVGYVPGEARALHFDLIGRPEPVRVLHEVIRAL